MIHLLNIAGHFKVDKLTNRHTRIDPDWLGAGNFQGPCIAESHIALAGGGVDVNAQPTNRRLPFQKRNVAMGFGVFFGHPKVQGSGLQDEAFRGNGEFLYGVIHLGVQNSGAVNGEVPSQMNIVGVGAQALPIERFDEDMSLVDGFENALVG